VGQVGAQRSRPEVQAPGRLLEVQLACGRLRDAGKHRDRTFRRRPPRVDAAALAGAQRRVEEHLPRGGASSIAWANAAGSLRTSSSGSLKAAGSRQIRAWTPSTAMTSTPEWPQPGRLVAVEAEDERLREPPEAVHLFTGERGAAARDGVLHTAAWAAMTSKYPSTITAACFATIAVLARSMPKIADDL